MDSGLKRPGELTRRTLLTIAAGSLALGLAATSADAQNKKIKVAAVFETPIE